MDALGRIKRKLQLEETQIAKQERIRRKKLSSPELHYQHMKETLGMEKFLG